MEDKDKDIDYITERMDQLGSVGVGVGGVRPKHRIPQQVGNSEQSDPEAIDMSYVESMRQQITCENEGMPAIEDEEEKTERLFMKSWQSVKEWDRDLKNKRKEAIMSPLIDRGFQSHGGRFVKPQCIQRSDQSAQGNIVHKERLTPQKPNHLFRVDDNFERRRAAIKKRDDEWLGMEDRQVSPIFLGDIEVKKIRHILSERRYQAVLGDSMSDFSDPSIPVTLPDKLPEALNVITENKDSDAVEDNEGVDG